MIREHNITWYLSQPERLMKMKPFTRGGKMEGHGYESSGLSRAGVGAAVTVLVMLVPLTIFIFSQSKIIETMSFSGIKE